MIKYKNNDDGTITVFSTEGKVSNGDYPATTIICTIDELEYITEVKEHEDN